MPDNDNIPELESCYMISRHLCSTGKTHTWAIDSKKGSDRLGVVMWYAAWREYVFEPADNCVFSRECLGDLRAFMSRANNAHGESTWPRRQTKEVTYLAHQRVQND